VSGRLPRADKKQGYVFRREMDALDEFLAQARGRRTPVKAFVARPSDPTSAPTSVRRARGAPQPCPSEPIQGEGGFEARESARFIAPVAPADARVRRAASSSTKCQTGLGHDGAGSGAHELFDPAVPAPILVTWAKEGAKRRPLRE